MSDKFRFNGTGLEIGIPLSDADSSAISQWAENAADLARKHEQERIIKELEANEHIWRERVVLVALKALIKGETK